MQTERRVKEWLQENYDIPNTAAVLRQFARETGFRPPRTNPKKAVKPERELRWHAEWLARQPMLFDHWYRLTQQTGTDDPSDPLRSIRRV